MGFVWHLILAGSLVLFSIADNAQAAVLKNDFSSILLSCIGKGMTNDSLFKNQFYLLPGGFLGVDEKRTEDAKTVMQETTRGGLGSLLTLPPGSTSDFALFKNIRTDNESSVHMCNFDKVKASDLPKLLNETVLTAKNDESCGPALLQSPEPGQYVADSEGKIIGKMFIKVNGDTTIIDIKPSDPSKGASEPSSLSFTVTPDSTTANITCPDGTKITKTVQIPNATETRQDGEKGSVR